MEDTTSTDPGGSTSEDSTGGSEMWLDNDFTSTPGIAHKFANRGHVATASNALSIAYFVIGSIGFLGNLLVIVVIFQYTAMRKILTNRYIINQSLVDGSAALFLIFTTVFEEDYDEKLVGTAGMLYCRLWLTKIATWSLFLSSTYNLVFLSVERYIAVAHPLKHKVFFSNTVVAITLAFIWGVGIIFNLCLKIPTSYVQDGICQSMKKWPSGEVQRGTGVFIIFLQFFIPLSVMGFCYGRMGIILKNRIRPGDITDGQDGHNQETSQAKKDEDMASKARKNIFKTLVLVSVCFVLCWIWNQVYIFLFNIGYIAVDFTSNYYHFSVIAVFLNCCANPLIYIVNYRQFRKGLYRLKKRVDCKGNDFYLTGSTKVTGSVNNSRGEVTPKVTGSGNHSRGEVTPKATGSGNHSRGEVTHK